MPMPWTQRILAMLETGEHTRQELIDATSMLVPPGRAHRAVLARREAVWRQRGIEPRDVPSSDRDFWVGARHIINQTLTQLVRNGRITRSYRNGETWFAKGRDRLQLSGTAIARERALRASKTIGWEGRSRASLKGWARRHARLASHANAEGRES